MFNTQHKVHKIKANSLFTVLKEIKTTSLLPCLFPKHFKYNAQC
jgi:hypothetical protein